MDAASSLAASPSPSGRRHTRRQGSIEPHERRRQAVRVVEAGGIPVELDYDLASFRRTIRRHALSGFTATRSSIRSRRTHACLMNRFSPSLIRRRDRTRHDQGADRLPAHSAHPGHGVSRSPQHCPDFPVTFAELSHTDFVALDYVDTAARNSAGMATCHGSSVRSAALFAFHFANWVLRWRSQNHRPAEHPRMFSR